MIHAVRIDAEHRYWVPGPRGVSGALGMSGEVQVPGYSEICKDLGIVKDNPFWTEDGREEGKVLHLWLNFLVNGKTAKTNPDPRIAGRVEGIRKFLRDTGFKISGGEVPIYDPINRYACTPDLSGHIGRTSWIVDMKRGAAQKTHPLQLGAQRIALRANGFRAMKTASLYLKDNDYRLVEHDTREHEARWIKYVDTYHSKRRYL